MVQRSLLHYIPFSYLNMNLLKVVGRTDILLKIEILKKAIAIPIIIISLRWGVLSLLWGFVLISLLEFLINCHYSGKQINYKLIEQISDIMPYIGQALLIGGVIFFVGNILSYNYMIQLLIQVVSSLSMMFILGKISQIETVLLFEKRLYRIFNIRNHKVK